MRTRSIQQAVLLATAISLVGLVGGALEACAGDNGSGTTGKRVTLRTKLVAEPAAKTTFKNALGWSVTLSKAYVATGAFYYFDGDPIFSRVDRRLDRLRGILLPRVAHAHPGHYVAGNARGEMTVASSVDLLAAGNDLPVGNGVTGSYRSARFTFGSPPAGPFAGALSGHVLTLEGTATNGAATLKFKTNADVPDVIDTFNEPRLDGCVFKPVEVVADGTVTVTVLPSVWFDQVDFADVKGDGVIDLAGTAAFNGLTRGVKKATAYVFAYAPN